MKKNIIITILTLLSLSLAIYSFVQKTQTEQATLKLEACEISTNQNRLEAEVQRTIAVEQRMIAEMRANEAVMLSMELQKVIANKERELVNKMK